MAARSAACVVVNGLETEAVVDHHLLDDVLMPELERLESASDRGRRTFAFLVAPPGAGKSTLAELLRARARHLDLDTVGIDGFHHPQAHLARHDLLDVKGAPETFDLHGLARHLRDSRDQVLTWPEYDRVLHDVRPGRRPLEADLVVVEGTWLLLDEPGWDRLADHSSLNVFIDAPPDLLRDRLVERKVRGGMSRDAALDFYEHSDRHNVDRVLTRTDRTKVDLLLHLRHDGTIEPRSTP